ncbi:MAG TPA: hypothetical protein VEL82_00965 [Thermoplasmata archaeon]|nr:hypothetical protein [Thermoplasmata archaeon]
MAVSAIDAYLGALALLAALAPLGLVLIRGAERAFGLRGFLTVPERAIVSIFAASTLFFLVASIPFPIFWPPVMWGILGAGGIALAVLWSHERWLGLRAGAAWVSTPTGALVVLVSLGLIAVEIVGGGTSAFPNVYDGAFQSLLANLIVANHTAVWTLQPYATAGVIYPQGAAVWFAFPNYLFGWSTITAAVVVPPLFLALSAPAAFCWGQRLGGVSGPRAARTGLVFLGFFALVASWPRLFIGGSYDFALSLPLFLVALGWLRPYAERGATRWGPTAAFGLLLGGLTSLSVACGDLLPILLIAFLVLYAPRLRLRWRAWAARLLAAIAIGTVFVARSIAGVVVWWHYPQHVLGATGSPPYAAQGGLPSLTWGLFVTYVYPFPPLRPKISPFPIMAGLIVVLLAAGVILCLLWFLRPAGTERRLLSADVVRPLVAITILAFAWTLALLFASASPFTATFANNLASVYESSYLLFILYGALTAIPTLAAVEYLAGRAAGDATDRGGDRPARRWSLEPAAARGRSAATALAVALVVVPIGVGGVTTVTEVPGYLGGHLAMFANVSAGDANGLRWAGAHLPACSRVLVAPGSAAMFLPLFARLGLVFPMYPISVNLSYNNAVNDLIAGTYTAGTRADLLELNVTEVFVTGQSSVSYLPFDPAVFATSHDFVTLFAQGDAQIYAFAPGEAATDCVFA